jgi:SAM-dependent methyltransferase
MNGRLRNAVLEVAWLPAFVYLYWRNLRRQGDSSRQRRELFRDFVSSRPGEKCLQIGVRGKKFGPDWVCVDLYDPSSEVDYHCDVADLPFDDASFDRITCNAILEHVPDPAGAIGELHRVLKPGGEIWAEVPFTEAYHPDPHDYWRVSTEGVERWMQGFRTLRIGVYSIHHCPFYTGVFYWGKKAERGNVDVPEAAL